MSGCPLCIVEETTRHRHWRVRHPEGLERPRTFETAAAAEAWRDRCADSRWIVEYVFRHREDPSTS